MIIYGDIDTNGGKLINVVLNHDATAGIDALLDALGKIGYDSTIKRVKVNDGSAIRYLLQFNDVATDISGGSELLASRQGVIDELDSLKLEIVNLPTQLDATSVSSFPSVDVGSSYEITVAGTIDGVDYAVGDFVFKTSNGWIGVQGKLETATDSVAGKVRLATPTEITNETGSGVITVDNLFAVITSNVATAGNGLTKTGQQITLGGTLTQTTIIDMDSNGLVLQNSDIVVTADNGGDRLIITDQTSELSIDDMSFQMNNVTGAVFTDSRTVKSGIHYAADYSSNFVDRSLVDKAYVDNAVAGVSSSSYTFTSGVNISGSDVKLGGSLTGATSIDAGVHNLSITSTTGNLQLVTNNATFDLLTSLYTGTSIKYAADYSSGYTDRSLVDKGYVDGLVASVNEPTYGDGLEKTGNTLNIGGTVADDITLSISDSEFIITATSGNIRLITNNRSLNIATGVVGGNDLKYDADYSSTFTSRSLVDKAYVDGAVSGSTTADNGLTKSANNIRLGGALAVDTLISMATYTMTYQNSLYTFNMSSSEFSVVGVSGAQFKVTGAQIDVILGSSSTGMVVTDNRISKKGIEYNDESIGAAFTDRSLVHKKYLVDTISSSIGTYVNSASNGLTLASQNVKLGGAVTENTTLSGGGSQTFTISGMSAVNILSSAGGAFHSSASYTYMGSLSTNFLWNSSGLQINIADGSSGLTINDGRTTHPGLVYAADYSSDFTSRSLVDKGYVDTVFAGGVSSASNGLTVVSGNVRLGGTVSGTTTVSGTGVQPGLVMSDLYLFRLSDDSSETVLELNGGVLTLGYTSTPITFSDAGFLISISSDATTADIRDSRATPTGLEYQADYSATYTDRSLVDKGYVDSVAVKKYVEVVNVTNAGTEITHNLGTTAVVVSALYDGAIVAVTVDSVTTSSVTVSSGSNYTGVQITVMG